jgi:hypothetical protein
MAYINLTQDDDYASRLASIARQQKMAEALSKMGEQEQAVYTAGGITAPMSPMGALARGLTSFGGSYLSGKAAADEAALKKGELSEAKDYYAGLRNKPAPYTLPGEGGGAPMDLNIVDPVTGRAAMTTAPRSMQERRNYAGEARFSDNPMIRSMADSLEAEATPVYRARTEYGGDLIDPRTQLPIQSFPSNAKTPASYHTATKNELVGYPLGTTAQYNETTKKLEEIHEPNQGNRFTINTGKTISDQIVEKGIGLVTDSQSAAQGAVDNKNTNANMLKLLDTNKVIAGPGAKFGLVLNQIFGKDPEKLVATRGIIKGLAETTVQARKQFKGQGQISDFETRTLEKAVSGDIDNLTVDEIRAVISANNKMNGIVINRHNNLMTKASGAFKSKDPQDFLKLFQVEEPTQDRKPWGTP